MKEFSLTLDGVPGDASDILLDLAYDGDTAELLLEGRKVADQFSLGNGWQIGLRRFGGATDFTLRIFSLAESARVFMNTKPVFHSGFACQLSGVTARAEYEVRFRPTPIAYCGRGRNVGHSEIMNLIDRCFGRTEPGQSLAGLLPKCYREEYRPQDSNYVVIDGEGNLTATVGAYDHELMVCGRRIPCRGIGNVGVHPDHRGRGYMKTAMNRALADMITDGIAISTLGGRRQRYQYFGYDKVAPTYCFRISDQNIRHALGGGPAPFAVAEVTDPADPVIASIRALNETSPLCPIRPAERYLDIATTWFSHLLVLWEGDRFVGYCIKDSGGTITELQLVRDADICGAVHTLHAYIGGPYTILLPLYQDAYAAALAPVAEDLSLNCAMHFNVLKYGPVMEGFLALKLTYTHLPDGDLTCLIHGYAGDERLRISVRDGAPSVTPLSDDDPVELELSHLEAMALFFGHVCPARNRAPAAARLWFPLPLWMYKADEV